jgi:hypothetical protein
MNKKMVWRTQRAEMALKTSMSTLSFLRLTHGRRRRSLRDAARFWIENEEACRLHP